jgi:phytanoyl-CoA hydroxylase
VSDHLINANKEGFMLSQSQLEEYDEIGAIVIPNVLSAEELKAIREVTDKIVAGAAGKTQHDDVYDLDETHSPDAPRVRRIKMPHRVHAEYNRYWRHPKVIAALQDLWGPNIRSDVSKLNLKLAGYGAPVEWHQDWVFYPHTNDDLAEVGVLIDDMTLDNGPMLIIPGSHKGPLFDHHFDGRFCGAMDPVDSGCDYSKAIPLVGTAGSITIHHARIVHGSGYNRSDADRRFMLMQFRSGDAWPLSWCQLDGAKSIEEFNSMIVAGEPTITPRVTNVPVRIPWPRQEKTGSIYENQSVLREKYFR